VIDAGEETGRHTPRYGPGPGGAGTVRTDPADPKPAAAKLARMPFCVSPQPSILKFEHVQNKILLREMRPVSFGKRFFPERAWCMLLGAVLVLAGESAAGLRRAIVADISLLWLRGRH
jgi:hypothetical protein